MKMTKARNLNYNFFKKLFFYISVFLLPTQLNKYFFFKESFILGVRKDLLAPFFSPLFIFIILFSALFFKENVQTLKKNKRIVIWSLLLVIINLLFSVNKIISFFKFFQVILLIFFIISIKKFIEQKLFSFKIFSFVILAIIAVEFFLAIYQFNFGRSFNSVFYFLGERAFSISTPGIAKVFFYKEIKLRPYSTFSHPNSMAGFMIITYFWFLQQKKKSFVNVLILFLTGALVLLSFSKAAIFLFFLLNIILIMKKSKCLGCKIARIFTFFFVFLLFFLTPFSAKSVAERILFIKQALILLKTYWLAGVGFGAYLTALAQAFPNTSLFYLQPVHNIFILFFLEFGLIGLALLLFIFKQKKEQLFSFFRKNKLLLFVIAFLGFFDHYFLTLNQNLFSIIFLFL